MRKTIAALLALPVTCLHAQTLVNSFNDIQFWAGTGTNRAAMVIQWPDQANPAGVVWGYRWNGESTAQQMIFALAGSLPGGPAPAQGSDSRLEFELLYYGAGLNDYFVDVIRFNQVGLGSSWTGTQRVMPGYDGVDFNALYYRYGTSAWTSALFTQASSGPAGIPLRDGTWIGWVYTDGNDTELPFVQPYAAPGSAAPAVPKPVASVRMTNGSAVVSVASQTNFTYQLAFTGTIGGTLTNQSSARLGTGGTISFTNSPPAGTAQRFYRVIVSR